ncbi:MAG: hypothetical protein Q9N02_03895, partial [Ghiorsea sp.]|nr:hypothetical protein [Ghiorsea sp.]
QPENAPEWGSQSPLMSFASGVFRSRFRLIPLKFAISTLENAHLHIRFKISLLPKHHTDRNIKENGIATVTNET